MILGFSAVRFLALYTIGSPPLFTTFRVSAHLSLFLYGRISGRLWPTYWSQSPSSLHSCALRTPFASPDNPDQACSHNCHTQKKKLFPDISRRHLSWQLPSVWIYLSLDLPNTMGTYPLGSAKPRLRRARLQDRRYTDISQTVVRRFPP